MLRALAQSAGSAHARALKLAGAALIARINRVRLPTAPNRSTIHCLTRGHGSGIDGFGRRTECALGASKHPRTKHAAAGDGMLDTNAPARERGPLVSSPCIPSEARSLLMTKLRCAPIRIVLRTSDPIVPFTSIQVLDRPRSRPEAPHATAALTRGPSSVIVDRSRGA